MKRSISSLISACIIILISITGCAQPETESNGYIDSIQKERHKTDVKFKSKDETILEEKDRKKFKQLEYFDIDVNYKVKARFEQIENGEVFEMKTSTDRLPVYKRYAMLYFNLNGIEYSLTAYQNQKFKDDEEYKDELFVPFTDLTNAVTTYGGGRYIDITIPEGDEVTLDFNTCYNPYCAYNYKYSCPIPPMENHIEIEILAGVKAFNEDH
jgi:uncharacterized protein (DUF1684 family)